MLQEHLNQFDEEFQLTTPLENNVARVEFIEDLPIFIKDLQPGFYLYAKMAVCPEENKEDLLMVLMEANFLGQGTGKGSIGLEKEENLLTLSYHVDYEVNYSAFKETLEDFLNYFLYWKEKIETFNKAKVL